MASANPVAKLICRCEADLPPNTVCKKCMGHDCTNLTYKYKDETYELLPATWLWTTGYYDGALSGFAIARGFPCFAKTYSDARDRSFWLYPLTKDEWTYMLYYRANPERTVKSDSIRAKPPGIWYHLAPTTWLLFERILASKPLGFYRFGPLPADSPYVNENPAIKATQFRDLHA